jgi:hypothetical protein
MAFRLVMPNDGVRSAVEDAIRAIYWERYAARLLSFPETLVADIDCSGNIDCAAGIRFGSQGLFSECYLDLPAEHFLSERFNRAIQRKRVVEICNLAATRSWGSLPFIQHLIELANDSDAEWSIFTATKPLRALLRRIGLNMIELTRADRTRVRNPDDWGHYYEHDPRVMALRLEPALGGAMAFPIFARTQEPAMPVPPSSSSVTR